MEYTKVYFRLRHLYPQVILNPRPSIMDFYRNATTRQKYLLLAATAAALGTGYIYYSSKVNVVPAARKVRE